MLIVAFNCVFSGLDNRFQCVFFFSISRYFLKMRKLSYCCLSKGLGCPGCALTL